MWKGDGTICRSDGAMTVQESYAKGEDRPLRGYLGALGTYAALVGAAVVVGRKTGTRLPDRVPVADLALLTVATHKASRLLTKSSVMAAVRAPFTRFEESAGVGEVQESVRSRGAGHSVGELLTCPFCAGVWIAGGFAAGLVFAPRATRLAASVLGVVAGSDLLQLAYEAVKQHVEGHPEQ